MKTLLCLVLSLCLLAAGAGADTGRRFPHSQITRGEWQTYLNEIRTTPGIEQLEDARPETVTYFNAAEQSVYCFTTGGPAHPAVVVTRVFEREGKVRLQNMGYFAGDEDAFASWFQSFTSLGPEIEKKLKAKP